VTLHRELPDSLAEALAEVGALRTEVERLSRRLSAVEAAANAAGRAVASSPVASSPEARPAEPGGRFDALYPAFQDRFRGSEADVRARLTHYLPEVQAAATGRGVLDVGPGRGEWLGMLAEHGIPAYGVEASAQMAGVLRARGLPVVQADAVAHLRGLEPGSLDVVSAIHVVEHLDLETLLGLLEAAKAALRPGGRLILETPNPTNLVMAACNFRFDPTHRNPLPPALTEFFVTALGFTDVVIRPLHPKEPVTPEDLQLGPAGAAGALLGQALAKAFFGPQDYAVLARTPAGQPARG